MYYTQNYQNQSSPSQPSHQPPLHQPQPQPSVYNTKSFSSIEFWGLISKKKINIKSGISSISFDTIHEQIWIGTKNGFLQCYKYHPSESNPLIISVRSFFTPVKKIFFVKNKLYCLSKDCIRQYTKNGLLEYSNNMKNVLCVIYEKGKLIFGREFSDMIVMNEGEMNVDDVIKTSQGIRVIKKDGKYVYCGGTQGELSIRDINDMKKEVGKLQVHSGSVMDISIGGGLLVTCGISKRYGRLNIDPMIKLFEIRTFRLMKQIRFSYSPSFLKFHTLFHNYLGIFSKRGVFQFKDISKNVEQYAGAGDVLNSVKMTSEVTKIHAVDISSSSKVMVLGDNSGVFYIYSTQNDGGKINTKGGGAFYNSNMVNHNQPKSRGELMYEQGYDRKQRGRNRKYPKMDIKSSLSIIPNFIGDKIEKLSDWNTKKVFTIGQHPPRIHPQILQCTIKLTRESGLLPNKKKILKISRNIKFVSNPGLSNTDEGYLYVIKQNTMNGMSYFYPQGNNIIKINLIPKDHEHNVLENNNISGYNRNQYDKNVGKFDVNKKFIGFESKVDDAIPNCILQIFYHLIPNLKTLFMNHICEKESCISCEIGFLFHMMKTMEDRNAPTKIVSPTNFFRVFSRIFNYSKVKKGKRENKVHHYFRFFLEQIKEEMSKPVDDKTKGGKKSNESSSSTTTTATATTIHELFESTKIRWRRCGQCQNIDRLKEFKLSIHDITIPSPKITSFNDVIKCTVTKNEGKLSLWCSKCGKVDTMAIKSSFVKMPNVMILNYQEKNIEWLRTQHLNNKCSDRVFPNNDGTTSKERSSVPKRIILNYNKTDEDWGVECFFDDYSDNNNDKKMKNGIKYTSGESAEYVLKGMICTIKDPFEKKNHTVCYIKVSKFWYLFNGASVIHQAKDVLNFSYQKNWKFLNTLFYVKNDKKFQEEMKNIKYVNPIKDPSQIFKGIDLKQIYGIDAEFIILKPSIFSSYQFRTLGRLSILKENEDVLIDEYIEVSGTEFVANHLTKYSGLVKGDLRKSTSTTKLNHNLVSLKQCYIGLRSLIDAGVRFVGHGLNTDFKILNVFVPTIQFEDTVKLFRMGNRRLLSLNFLSQVLLNKNIQENTHCSIEDSLSALRLYKIYKKLEEEGKIGTILQKLYELGRRRNWTRQNFDKMVYEEENENDNIIMQLRGEINVLNISSNSSREKEDIRIEKGGKSPLLLSLIHQNDDSRIKVIIEDNKKEDEKEIVETDATENEKSDSIPLSEDEIFQITKDELVSIVED